MLLQALRTHWVRAELVARAADDEQAQAKSVSTVQPMEDLAARRQDCAQDGTSDWAELTQPA